MILIKKIFFSIIILFKVVISFLVYPFFSNKYKNTIIIGTRHGEKLYEALLSREEMLAAIDMGDYYRVPPDLRDLNYDKYVEQGDSRISEIEDYNSHNTTRLDVDGMKKLLLKLPLIQKLYTNKI